MWQKLILDVAISFILRQLIKYGESVEWSLVREALRERIRKIVPGDAFDSIAVEFVDRIIDGVEYLLENLEFAGVLEALKNKDFDAAFKELKTLIKRYLGLV